MKTVKNVDGLLYTLCDNNLANVNLLLTLTVKLIPINVKTEKRQQSVITFPHVISPEP